MHDELKQEHNRLTNRMRDQLWLYYPQMHALREDFASDWFLDLWHAVPTPDAAARATNRRSGASSRTTAFAASMLRPCSAFCASRR